MKATTKTFTSFKDLFADQCPERAAKLAEGERRAKENEARQKAAATAKKQAAETYRRLAEGAACLWRISRRHKYTKYEEYAKILNEVHPPKEKYALQALKDMQTMGISDFSEESLESQMHYYLDSLNDL